MPIEEAPHCWEPLAGPVALLRAMDVVSTALQGAMPPGAVPEGHTVGIFFSVMWPSCFWQMR
jgi:hypothetical protein